MATWPTRKQYVASIQRADQCFVPQDLRTARFQEDMLGMPLASSGQTAMVFKADVGGRDRAIRLFTSETHAGRARYRALADHLGSHHLPSVAEAEWLEDAILVDGQPYPVVVMEWVAGSAMGVGIEDRLHDAPRLAHLATVWRHQVGELRAARMAHGDLQHGNVLLDDSDRFRFIDLDGVWVPAIASHPPSEFGQPNYQHPDRTSGDVWGEHIDWFSALVIYVSLIALAADPSLWRFHHGDNLIFRDTDFRGDASIWHDLASSPNADVVSHGNLLAQCCNADPLEAIDLDTLLAQGTAPRGKANGSTTQTPVDPPQADAWWATGPSSVPGTSGAAADSSSKTGRASTSGPMPGGPSVPKQRKEAPKERVNSAWGTGPSGSSPQPPSASSSDVQVGGVAFTARQFEVLERFAAGQDIEEIAYFLKIKPKTVQSHIRKCAQRVRVPSTDDLRHWLVANGVGSQPTWPHSARSTSPPPPSRPPPSHTTPSNTTPSNTTPQQDVFGRTPSPPPPSSVPNPSAPEEFGASILGRVGAAFMIGLGIAALGAGGVVFAVFCIVLGLVIWFASGSSA